MNTRAKTMLLRLEEAGYTAYAVGGSVRDLLMGTLPHDIDIATSATPEEVKAVFFGEKVIETGIKHGTLTVLYEGEPFEITTYRVETTYSDARHPDAVIFTRRIEDDLSRRDFTVNAMALDKEGSLVDLFGGKEDIENKVLRCVGDPYERFSEDALRILRLLRFSSILDFQIEAKTEEAAFALKDSLSKVSVERVAVELNKLLLGKGVFRVLTRYVDILGSVIPELLPIKGFEQKNYHHQYDVLTHTAKAVEAAEPSKTVRLAMLFHDIGKPHTFSLGSNGVGHFYGHASISRDMTDAILTRLKYDNKTKDTVVRLVKWHDHVIEPDERAVKRMLSRSTPAFMRELLAVKRADTAALAEAYTDRENEFLAIETLMDNILARQECFSLKDLSVNGQDLLAIGFLPGKEVGLWLSRLLEEVVSGRLPNDKEALLTFVKQNTK